MNKIRRNILGLAITATVVFSIFSCADNKTVGYDEDDYYAVVDAYVAKNYPHLTQVEGKRGVYMKFYRFAGASSIKPTDSSYVEINYSAKTIYGSYLATTDIALTNHLGTFEPVANYVPFKFRMVNYGSYIGLTNAQYEALKQMHIGDTVEIIATPNYGYYYSAEQMYEGFRGTKSIAAGDIAHIKMTLENFTDFAEQQAKNEVREYIDGGNWSSPETGLYYRKTFINDNEADSVRKDSTLSIKYVGRFISGFVFDTNIRDTAEKHNIYDASNSSKYTTGYSFHYTNDTDSVNYGGTIRAWRPVISRMRLGEKATLIAYPSLCYGASGVYNTTGTLIFTQTPLIFDIEIIKPEEDED